MYSMEQNVVCRKRKSPAKRGLAILFAACLAALILLCVFAEGCVRGPVLVLACERGRALAAGTMSFAVMAALEEEQGEMLKVTREEGGGCFVIADTAKINRVASLASADAQRRMEELGKDGVDLSVGDASGVVLMGGRGPNVRVGFTPVGSITAETVSSLRSSGINQCIYSVDLILTARVRIVLGGRAKVIEVTGANPICQTVIVGEVPQVYTNVANEEDMLNLIPNEVPQQ